MAVLVLPFDSDNVDYEILTSLDGADWLFRVRWEDRPAAWYFDLYTADRTPVLLGQRIATNTILNRAAKDTLQGSLFAISTDALDTTDPGRNDLGNRVKVTYRESTF